MRNFIIEEGTREEITLVNNSLVDYNFSKVPPIREPHITHINKVIKGENGEVLAGLISVIYGWDYLHIYILWVKEDCRTEGYGVALLKEAEKAAKEMGCKMITLETFEFQAKDFYLKNGYEIFGVLENCPFEYNTYYMKKNI
ncbi:GNAT family N-acetyltransferase [Clostridium sp. UBA4548]|nr:GNAT family N-acetyltransferase [Clostridium sp. UBA4548]